MTQIVSPVIQTVSYNYFEAGEQALKEINQLLKGEQTALKIKFLSIELTCIEILF